MLDRQQELKAEKGLAEDNEPDIESAMHAERGKASSASRGSRASR
jgi:hypothetical protein